MPNQSIPRAEENHLMNMTAGSVPDGAKLKIDLVYDWRGRRIRKDVSTYGGSVIGYQLAKRTIYVYDGWNLVAELNVPVAGGATTLLRSYIWGLDLSGSQQGAGGVGGLLWVSQISNSQITNYFAAFDGNGNVAALINANNGTVSATYEYGPFGEVLRTTGP